MSRFSTFINALCTSQCFELLVVLCMPSEIFVRPLVDTKIHPCLLTEGKKGIFDIFAEEQPVVPPHTLQILILVGVLVFFGSCSLRFLILFLKYATASRWCFYYVLNLVTRTHVHLCLQHRAICTALLKHVFY